MYKKEGKNEDNFIFKLSIFYDKCQFISLYLETYFESAFVMLISQVKTYFYVNCEFILLFNDFCEKIQLFFKNLKRKCFNFIK